MSASVFISFPLERMLRTVTQRMAALSTDLDQLGLAPPTSDGFLFDFQQLLLLIYMHAGLSCRVGIVSRVLRPVKPDSPTGSASPHTLSRSRPGSMETGLRTAAERPQ